MGNGVTTSSSTILDLGSLGQLKGFITQRDGKQGPLARAFLAVPFVLPPTGEYRWRKPRLLPDDYTYNTPSGAPRDCTKFGPVCPQPVYSPIGNHDQGENHDEDCLVLNIWTPVGEPPEGGWPVVLWFHGGWLQVGNPSLEKSMDPSDLIAASGANLNAIFIASSYRVSVLGFMACGELLQEAESLGEASERACGNYGFWDQRAALEWIHKTIHHFGGDAKNLTLSGRSAGAYSVHAQAAHDFFLAPPSPEPLFRRLVMYSNAIPADPKTIEEVQPQFEELLAACSISPSLSGAEKLAALRAIPSKDLISHVMALKAHTFRAVRDGYFFPHDLFGRFLRGDFAKEFKERGMKILIGEVRDEETLYRQTNPPTDLKTLYEEVGNYYSPAVTEKLIDLYHVRRVHDAGAHPDPDPNIGPWKKIFGDIISDGQVRAPSRLLVRQLHAEGVPLSSIHRYMIAWRLSFIDKIGGPEFGVMHTYDKPIWNFSLNQGPTPEEEAKMRAWIKDLVDFVNGRDSDFGTRALEEHKVLRPDGTIAIEKDGKWEYLVTVADEVSATK